jgi:hypothetical protein
MTFPTVTKAEPEGIPSVGGKTGGAPAAVEDPELAAVAAAWPALPAAIRAGILAMVRAAGGTQPG